MIPSIRTFLLINLLLSITLITSLAIIGNIFLEHRDLRDHLDAQLGMIATTIEAFSSDGLDQADLVSIQSALNKVPSRVTKIENEEQRRVFAPLHTLIQFQIYDKDDKLILKTPDAPPADLSTARAGLSDQWIEGKAWRVFSTYKPSLGIKIVVAEQYDFRANVENHITKDSIFIMALTYPFLGLLIWIVVGRGLDSLKRITKAVRQRDPAYLEPVNIQETPKEVKPLITALNKLFARLQDALEREKRFAADAAHELRTPLAALRAQADVASTSPDEKQRQMLLKELITGVDRCTHVVEQLLTMTRMSSENVTMELEDVDIVNISTDMIALMVPAALKKDSEIELKSDEKHLIIKGIPGALSILLRNLLDNAIRYSPEKSLVTVLIDQDDKHVHLHVIDNGPGIPKHLRKRVFERFYRVLGTKTQGSGLGLGIVQQITKLHNAKLTLGEPISGQGLEVIVSFPLQVSTEKQKKKS